MEQIQKELEEDLKLEKVNQEYLKKQKEEIEREKKKMKKQKKIMLII